MLIFFVFSIFFLVEIRFLADLRFCKSLKEGDFINIILRENKIMNCITLKENKIMNLEFTSTTSFAH
jgi:hypothetical protein